jgi:hypothetical protein
LYTAPPLAGGDHHLLATSSAVSAHESVKLGSCNTTTTTTTATTTTTKNNYNAGITAYQRLPAKLDPDGSEDLPLRDTAAAEVIEIEDDTDEFPSTPSKPTPDITAMRETSNGKVPWGKLFQTRQLWAIIITQFCQSWSYWLFLNWMPTYYKDVFGADIEEIGYFTGKCVPHVTRSFHNTPSHLFM